MNGFLLVQRRQQLQIPCLFLPDIHFKRPEIELVNIWIVCSHDCIVKLVKDRFEVCVIAFQRIVMSES